MRRRNRTPPHEPHQPPTTPTLCSHKQVLHFFHSLIYLHKILHSFTFTSSISCLSLASCTPTHTPIHLSINKSSISQFSFLTAFNFTSLANENAIGSSGVLVDGFLASPQLAFLAHSPLTPSRSKTHLPPPLPTHHPLTFH